VGIPPEPIEADLNIKVIAPSLQQGQVLGILRICSLPYLPFQKAEHHIDSRQATSNYSIVSFGCVCRVCQPDALCRRRDEASTAFHNYDAQADPRY
jgi:hypothetical protein